jgi:hypothetical protein
VAIPSDKLNVFSTAGDALVKALNEQGISAAFAPDWGVPILNAGAIPIIVGKKPP